MLGISILRNINECQLVTSGIKNCRFNRLFKGCSPLQLLCNLKVNRPQSATFHTADRWAQALFFIAFQLFYCKFVKSTYGQITR